MKKSSPAKVEVNVFFTTLIRLILPLYAECREMVPCNLRKDFLEIFTFHKSAYLSMGTKLLKSN